MQLIVKRYLYRASILAGLSILLGLALSLVVYQATEKVRSNAIDLVEHRIPILTGVSELIADLSEQERIIYEYYRSMEPDVFLKSSAEIQATFSMHFAFIRSQGSLLTQSGQIESKQQEIIALFEEFHQLMQMDENNWDELREVLTQVSHIRITLMPTLKEIENITKNAVKEGHQKTLSQMLVTHWLVVVYGAFIVIVGAVVSWYIRQYILTQAKSERLALFSQRNPNPILSVNQSGEVIFANPASEKLLACVGLPTENFDKLLPENFSKIVENIEQTEAHSCEIEHHLAQRILQISIYWHKELGAYDIHIKDITERVEAEKKVNQLAFNHQESHLPNLYKLTDDLTSMIEQQAERKFTLGVISIRQYNEKLAMHGGEVMISVVRCLAKVIAKHLPASIHFYHISEHEFALICDESTSSLALQKLTKHITAAAEKALVTQYGEFFIECDFSFAMYPAHGDSANTLLKNAHIALNLVSQNEHENYGLFSPELAEKIEKDNYFLEKLRNAIALDELYLVFQPQLDLKQNKIMGVETLVRWRHQNTIISPADFIPMAEQSGLIVPIGQWILQKACHFARELVQQGYLDLVVAVNISPRQFSHPSFIQTVKDALLASGLPPENLELEITEGVFMHNENQTIDMLEHLKTLGVQLSIDDFGTGYSSLSYLKQFPVDKLKIDQSFIRHCHENEEDRAIVSTIVDLGRNLDLSLIAEGGELLEHVEFLKEIGCDELQGYWFSRPLEQAQLVDFLHSHDQQDGDSKKAG